MQRLLRQRRQLRRAELRQQLESLKAMYGKMEGRAMVAEAKQAEAN